MIRVAFRYGDKRLFSRLVCWLRGGDSAHCEVVINETVQYKGCIGASWLDGGVRFKWIEMPTEKWRIYKVPVSIEYAFTWLEQHHGAGYDIPGLLGFVVPWIKHRMSWWFCSELVVDIMRQAGIEGLDPPHTYDLIKLEDLCKRLGVREQ